MDASLCFFWTAFEPCGGNFPFVCFRCFEGVHTAMLRVYPPLPGPVLLNCVLLNRIPFSLTSGSLATLEHLNQIYNWGDVIKTCYQIGF